jgi:hypothetical protein
LYKSLLLSVILCASLYGDAKKYVGMSYGSFSEKFSNLNETDKTSLTTLKVGYGDHKAYSIEFSLQRAENNSAIFSKSDGNKYGFNIELIKAFDISKYLYPFFKVGFGTGRVSISQADQDSLYSGSFNIGIGSYIPLNQYIDIEVGYNYRYNSYEKFEEENRVVSYNSKVTIFYSGLNLRF